MASRKRTTGMKCSSTKQCKGKLVCSENKRCRKSRRRASKRTSRRASSSRSAPKRRTSKRTSRRRSSKRSKRSASKRSNKGAVRHNVKAYCVREKKKVTLATGRVKTTRNGRKMVQGKCPHCDCKCSVFVSS